MDCETLGARSRRPIGVFDSGLGGVSVLNELRALLPAEDVIYYGDNGNAPYGERSEEEIRRLTLESVERLEAMDVKALLVACNTATSAAIDAVRERLKIPVVGMEPAIKPASELATGGRVLVMATTATLRLRKFHELVDRLDARDRIVPVPCPGLVELIEEGCLDGVRVRNLLRDLLGPFLGESAAVAVLGCTHYPFVRTSIQEVLGAHIPILDGNRGTVAHLQHVLREQVLLRKGGHGEQGKVTFMTSGDAPRSRALFHILLSKPH